jgi:hypothetical protein
LPLNIEPVITSIQPESDECRSKICHLPFQGLSTITIINGLWPNFYTINHRQRKMIERSAGVLHFPPLQLTIGGGRSDQKNVKEVLECLLRSLSRETDCKTLILKG